ncbi:MAG TPA: 4-alpha-glucanotransferase [Cyanobacteria bacterium UBA8553]|nr:4-alpha-glucanotransferase [Cyanobacteria bacterium UBA8553]
MFFPRSSGVLLHPTCFPSQFGIGDLGYEASRFIEFLAESNQQYWQILPLSPCDENPYVSYGAMAGNPLLISPEKLRDEGKLFDSDFWYLPEFNSEKVEFEKVKQTKMPLLEKACEHFKVNATQEQQKEFREFCEVARYWLDDYALFMAFRDTFGTPWYEWKPEIVKRDRQAIELWRRRLAPEIFFHKYLQFEFFRQWLNLKNYANEKRIKIIGDIPIYVSHNSADVWANREIFCLNEATNQPILVAGTPPDDFSSSGQLWGNPVYNWEYLQSTRFAWWVERVRETLAYVDLIRIDHFRGLESFWSVPAGEETAINGRWVKAPGHALFETIRAELGSLPILAEDLGDIDQAVLDLRDHFEFPGMKILHFAFGSDAQNAYLPFNFNANCVVYTGTHDNDTTVGWYNQASDHERWRLHQYLGCTGSDGIAWDLIRLTLSSVTNQAIIPLQDVFSLGTDARMNAPGTAEGNWGWRYRGEALTQEYSDRLRDMVFIYGRQNIN